MLLYLLALFYALLSTCHALCPLVCLMNSYSSFKTCSKCSSFMKALVTMHLHSQQLIIPLVQLHKALYFPIAIPWNCDDLCTWLPLPPTWLWITQGWGMCLICLNPWVPSTRLALKRLVESEWMNEWMMGTLSPLILVLLQSGYLCNC